MSYLGTQLTNRAAPQFGKFALFSLAVHLSVLMVWQPEVLFLGNKDNILSISLMDLPPLPPPSPLHIDDAKAKAPLQVQHTNRMDHQKKETVLVEAASVPNAVRFAANQAPVEANGAIAGAPTEKSKTAPAQDTPATSAASTAAESTAEPHEPVIARIRARLLSDLARYFEYPAVARQRGWQGAVLLGFRVESDGHLEKIHVARSSGYAILDNSALNSLNRLGLLTEAVTWRNGNSLDMQLPVIYQLIEN